MDRTLIVVLGPTGVGKTELSLRLAEHYGVPIVNADSRQIFAELPIGTAAPTSEQRQRVRHFFVGNHHIEDYYSASMYEQDVLSWLDDWFQQHPLALMCGGSMMYIDAVCKGIDDIPTIHEATRKWMKERLAKEGLTTLVEELRELDPAYYQVVDKNNPRRVVHALEICHQSGRAYSSFRTHTAKQRPFSIVKIGLDLPRDVLYERINCRVIKMMESGLEAEARAVYPKKGLQSLNTVGYKELFAYFEGEIDKPEAIRQIQSNTRRYMRKQLTWFRKDKSIRWFSPADFDKIRDYIDDAIKQEK